MDIERTKRFYRDLKRSNLCDCAYCRNYVNEAAKAYPAVTAYLQTLGVDIAKPFETMPLELDEDGRMPYIGPQYLVFGEEEGFAAATVTPAYNHIIFCNQKNLLYGDYFIDPSPCDGFMGTTIEYGSTNLTVKTMCIICNALNVNLRDIIR